MICCVVLLALSFFFLSLHFVQYQFFFFIAFTLLSNSSRRLFLGCVRSHCYPSYHSCNIPCARFSVYVSSFPNIFWLISVLRYPALINFGCLSEYPVFLFSTWRLINNTLIQDCEIVSKCTKVLSIIYPKVVQVDPQESTGICVGVNKKSFHKV